MKKSLVKQLTGQYKWWSTVYILKSAIKIKSEEKRASISWSYLGDWENFMKERQQKKTALWLN